MTRLSGQQRCSVDRQMRRKQRMRTIALIRVNSAQFCLFVSLCNARLFDLHRLLPSHCNPLFIFVLLRFSASCYFLSPLCWCLVREHVLFVSSTISGCGILGKWDCNKQMWLIKSNWLSLYQPHMLLI